MSTDAATEAARASWNDRYAARDYVWSVEPNRYVAEHLADLEPGRAIDVAAGEGRNSVWLASRGWTVTAVDFSRAGLDKAARLAADQGVAVDLVEADVTTWQPGDPVDLVVLAYVQLVADQRRAVVGHAARWVDAGGTFFLVAHDQSNVEHGHGGPSSPDVCYTVDEVAAALDGFDLTTAEVARRPVATDAGERTALDTLVVATRRR